ncbi:DUF2149 domain-containing protein [Variovorax sp. GB1P17]|uniref:DUF2149 domain-containing protein n=1 Tax=Variovorax sp. GB1P17 TaxID=3443740 RepID=UPI003F48A970
MADMLTPKDFTVVKNPGKADMEIITREGGKVSRYVAGDAAAGSRQGQRVGTAYRLESGEIIYVPEGEAAGVSKLRSKSMWSTSTGREKQPFHCEQRMSTQAADG